MNLVLSTFAEAIDQMDFPAVILVFMLVVILLAMSAKQKDPNFDWGDAFRDEKGKVSWTHTATPIALALSSWMIIYVLMNGIRTTEDATGLVVVLNALFRWFMGYNLIWAGTPIIGKIIDTAQQYFSDRKPASPPANTPPSQ